MEDPPNLMVPTFGRIFFGDIFHIGILQNMENMGDPPFQIFIFPYFPISTMSIWEDIPSAIFSPKEEHLWKIGDLMADPEPVGIFPKLLWIANVYPDRNPADMGSSSSPAKNIKKPPF